MSGSRPSRVFGNFPEWVSAGPLRFYTLFALLTVLPLGLFTYYADRAYQQEAEQRAYEEGTQFARLSAVYLEDHFKRAESELSFASEMPEFLSAWKRRDMKAVRSALQQIEMHQPDALAVSVYTTDGVFQTDYPEHPELVGVNFSYRDWYQGVARTWKPYVSEVYRPKTRPYPLSIGVAVPILGKDGRPTAILAAAYSLERITRWLGEMNAPDVRSVLVVDQHGQLLAGPKIDVFAPPVEMRSYGPVSELMRGNRGEGRFTREGREVLASYFPLSDLGWGVVVEQPSSVLASRVGTMRRQMAAFFLVFFALALVCGQLVGTLYKGKQKLAQQLQSVADSEARYRSIIHGASYGIFRSVKGRFLAVNPAMVRLLGYETEEEVIRLDIGTDVYLDTDERTLLLDALEKDGVVQGMELSWKRKDGGAMIVSMSGRKWKDPATGDSTYEFIVQDITEAKRLEQQLRQTQRMEAVGRLAGGVAHDFNNLLTVISGYTQISLDQIEESSVLHKDLTEVYHAAERAAELTRQLLAFSRRQVLAPKVLELNTVVKGMEGLLHRLLGQRIQIVFHMRPETGLIQADPSQLEQVVMNLAVNARDSMPDGGMLTIETAPSLLDKAHRHGSFEVPPGDYAMLAVSDTGTGIAPEVLGHIFEPFFTTKSSERGTGLGLSTVYGIVKQSGGYIWVYSEVGKGTTFKIFLPRSLAPDAALPAQAPERRLTRGHETVLLAEDQDTVRSLVRSVLQLSGYTVLDARDGTEAVGLFEKNSRHVDLLLTDVYMKKMGGRELADMLWTKSPGLRVVFMTGYMDDETLRTGLPGSAILLHKPFHTEDLLSTVRKALDAAVPAPAKTDA